MFLSFEDVTFDRSRKLPTLYPELLQEERNQKYLDIVRSAFERATAGMPPEKKAERLAGMRYETDGITSTGMADYFLLDHDLTGMSEKYMDLIDSISPQSCAYLHNLQGDVIGLVDSNGTKMVFYTYDAWGRPRSKSGTLASTLGTLNPFGYRGYVCDEDTELYYLRN